MSDDSVLTERLEKWRKRARLFHEAYKEASFEAFSLNLQKMQLEAYGANQVLPMQNESLREKLLEADIDRNEYKRQRDDLSDEMERCHRLLDVHYGESLETTSIETLETRLEGLLAELHKGDETMSDEEKTTESILRVESQNDRYRNPKGTYPVCKPQRKSNLCERCGNPIVKFAPCPAVPPEQRWGEDYE